MLPKASYPILISRLLERTAYYSYRSVFVIHLIKSLESETVYEYFGALGILAVITYIFSPIGGLIGDLGLGNKITAIVGAAIMAVGMFMLCIPTNEYIYPSVMATGFGVALYSPNVLALYAKHYLNRPADLDAGFNLFYVFINSGALISTFLIASFSVDNYSVWIVVLIANIAAAAIIPLFFVKDIPLTEITLPEKPKGNLHALFITLAIVLPAFYWMFYEFGSGDHFMVKAKSAALFFTGDESLRFILHAIISAIFVLVLGIIFLFIWKRYKWGQTLKMALGFCVAGIAFLILYTLPESVTATNALLFIFALLLLSFSELLVFTASLSSISLFTKPKYYAVLFSASIAATWFLQQIFDNSLIPKDLENQPLISLETLALVSLSVIGVILLLVTIITSKKSTTP